MIKIKDFYERVRAVLNVSNTSISNEIIDFYEFRGLAEDKIKNIFPNWMSFPEDSSKYRQFESAIIYQTALLLCPTVKNMNIKVKQITGGKVEYFEPSDLEVEIQKKLDTIFSQIDENFIKGYSFFKLTNT